MAKSNEKTKTCVWNLEVPQPPSDMELIQQELEKQKAVRIHPLIDYHPETGLTIGSVLGGSSKSLIFMEKKAFIAEFENPLNQGAFANSLSIIHPKFAVLDRTHFSQMLLLAEDHFSGKRLFFRPKTRFSRRRLRKCATIGTTLTAVFKFWWRAGVSAPTCTHYSSSTQPCVPKG